MALGSVAPETDIGFWLTAEPGLGSFISRMGICVSRTTWTRMVRVLPEWSDAATDMTLGPSSSESCLVKYRLSSTAGRPLTVTSAPTSEIPVTVIVRWLVELPSSGENICRTGPIVSIVNEMVVRTWLPTMSGVMTRAMCSPSESGLV